MKMTDEKLNEALELLSELLTMMEMPSIGMVVCGGASLCLTGLYSRTTQDVDILALYDEEENKLLSPAPLPEKLILASSMVAKEMDLPDGWLNNGPSSDEGGLFQMGLPEGISTRLIKHQYGDCLRVYFISRFDQIHLKLYAAIDQPNSYHTTDLKHLKPTSDELESAIRWAMTHDTSEGFKIVARDFIRYLGFDDVANRI